MDESRDWLPPMPEPERMIRLVRIPDSQAGNAGTELNFDLVDIHVQLETFLLADVPNYKALSYTWGCPFSDPKEAAWWNAHVSANPAITCNGRKVSVTNTLLAALRCVRQLSPNTWLWTDALCIDQTNDSEKLVQINLMGEIYSSATETLVWLAPRVEQSLLFHRYYHKLASLGDIPLTERRDRHSAITDIFGSATFDARARMFNEILHFGRLNWWTRTWTLQEFALAKACTLIYGELRFHGKILLNFLELFVELSKFDQKMARHLRTLFRHNLMFRLKSRHMLVTAQQDPPVLVSNLDDAHGCHNFAAILMEMLGQTVELKTTDPRDAILGVVGICRVLAEHLGQSVGARFPPAGALSATELAAAVAKVALLDVPILSVLRFAGSSEERDDIPSWTPDFTRPVYGTLSKQKYDASAISSNPCSISSCLAGRSFKFLPNPLDPSRQRQALHLEALKLSTITSTTTLRHAPETTPTTTPTNFEYRTIIALLTFCLSLPKSYWSSHHRENNNGLWQTLYAGNPTVTQTIVQVGIMVNLYLYASSLPSDEQSTVLDFLSQSEYERLVEVLGFNVLEDFKAVPVILESKCPEQRAAFLETLKRKQPLNDMPNSAQWLLNLSGDRIGLTTRPCEENDEIWILRGGEYPSVLRPVLGEGDNMFRLIGDTYVDGVMHGEWIRQHSESEDSIEWVTICLI